MVKKRTKAPWWTEFVALGVVLVLGVVIVIWVLSKPHVVLAPTPRIIVLATVALLFAAVVTAHGFARLELKAPGLLFVGTGAVAVALGSLLLLVHLSRPDQQVAVYHVVYKGGRPVRWLEKDGAVEVLASRRGTAPTKYVDGNTIVLVFPEQVETAEIRLVDQATGQTITRPISYTEEETTIEVPDLAGGP